MTDSSKNPDGAGKIVIKGARTHNLKNVSVDPAPNFGLVEEFRNYIFASNHMARVSNIHIRASTKGSQSWFLGGQEK
ncbi:hypothetical protein A3A37_03280 [Candidatus Kaiserbacteria bacterium RIFCSPLOWO2_01_FULL_52_36]|nr:MAG: hypothetical protein A3A37_03280 [Candidatus Kaiserbacteria bacterium RIFCSPLOWO2_01_FULL_52_36]